MGNGPRVKPTTTIALDIETSGLSINDIENAAIKALSNFGSSNKILISPHALTPLKAFFGYEEHPEYSGTPWAQYGKLTKRERAVAGLHTFLSDLGVLKKIEQEEFHSIANKATRRLKRAKWAQYNRKKVQSPL